VIDPPGVLTEQKFTQPPARYNEGSLVKALEDLGIGRPSTYAEIVSKVLSRDYVQKQDKQLVPTKLGTTKTHGLRARFPTVVDYEFTAKIEKRPRRGRVGRGRLGEARRRDLQALQGDRGRGDERQGARRGLAARGAERSHLRQVRLADGQALGSQQQLLRLHRRTPSARTSSTRTPRRRRRSTPIASARSAGATCW
jgi:hypothetical protein